MSLFFMVMKFIFTALFIRCCNYKFMPILCGLLAKILLLHCGWGLFKKISYAH